MKNKFYKTVQMLDSWVKTSILMFILVIAIFHNASGQTYAQVIDENSAPYINVNGVIVTITKSGEGAGTTNVSQTGPYAFISKPGNWTFAFCPAINSLQLRIVMATVKTLSGGRQVADFFINGNSYNIIPGTVKPLLYPNEVITDSSGSIINKTASDPIPCCTVPSGMLTIKSGSPIYSLTITNDGSTLNTVSAWSFGLFIPPATFPYIPPAISPIIAPNGPTAFCPGGSVILSASPTTGHIYQWQNNTINIPNATKSSYTATTSGIYTVISDCSPPSPPVTVTVYATAIFAEGSTTFCTGSSVKLTAFPDAGNTYQWQNNAVNIPGATNSSYTATTSGNYTVSTICSTSNPITVTLLPAIFPAVMGPSTRAVCEGSSVYLETTDLQHTPGFWQWQKDMIDIPGATNWDYTATTSGTYRVKNKCFPGSHSNPVDITVLTSNSMGLNFAGGYISCAYMTCPQYQTDGTIEAWVNPDLTNYSNVNSIVRYSGCYNLYIDNGVLTAQIWPNRGSSNFKKLVATNLIPPNTWSHVAVTWSYQYGAFSLYINGVLTPSTITDGIDARTEEFRYIGASKNYNQPFIGSLDEVRLWFHSRCQAELDSNMYNELSSTSPARLGLDSYYKLNDGGHYALDEGGYCNSLGSLKDFAFKGTTSNWVNGKVGRTPFEGELHPYSNSPGESPIGVGDTLKLFLYSNPPPATYFYEWSGPNNFHSTKAAPIIVNVPFSATGIYYVRITGPGACPKWGSTNVQIKP